MSCKLLQNISMIFYVLDKDIDEEYEYRQAAVISEVGGLDIILKRLIDVIFRFLIHSLGCKYLFCLLDC